MPKKNSELELLRKYVEQIDQFAGMLRQGDETIDALKREEAARKAAYDDIRASHKEAKDSQVATVKLLLHFVRPGTTDIMPLFDTMEPADEEVQGTGASEWRKEPINVLGLSAAALRALIEADIVLVGQLQDLLIKSPDDWYAEMATVTPGMAEAIAAKFHAFVAEKTK